MDYLIGVDAGTSSFKAALLDRDGNVAATARREYVLLTSGGRVEFPPEQYWALFCAVVNDLMEKSGVDARRVAALAISSQGETLVCVDEDSRPVGNAIVWLDNRSVGECGIIGERFSPQELYVHTGQCEVEPTWTATKLLWMREHEPDRMKRSRRFLLLEDYLLLRLTGRCVCERTLPASTLLYDIPAGAWWPDMLEFIGIPEQKLPRLTDSAAPVATLCADAARQTGLTAGTLAVAGALDQIASMVGSGNVRPGKITEVTGSCLVVETVAGRFAGYRPGLRLTCQPFCIPGRYLLLMFSNTAGMALKWFRDCFYPDGSMDYGALCDEAADIPPGAAGLIMLPHLAGSQFPLYNPQARGVFRGMTLEHRRGHFVRSILEAVAYIERSMLDELEGSGYPIGEIAALGGGAGNALWNAIKADVVSRSISTLEVKETASAGAAALAGVGCGLFESVEQASSLLDRPGEVCRPDEARAAVYEELYAAYRRVNDACSGMEAE